MATQGRNRGKNNSLSQNQQDDDISTPQQYQGIGGDHDPIIEESGMRVSGDYYLPDQVSGTRQFATGVNRINSGRSNHYVKKSSFVHANPHSRYMNDHLHNSKPRYGNLPKPYRPSKPRTGPIGLSNSPIMKGNDRGVTQKDLVYYTYAVSGKRYLGNRQYKGGGGNWFVDGEDGMRHKLKQHIIVRNEITQNNIEMWTDERFDEWVRSFSTMRGCQCQRVHWWSGNYDRHCVGSQCASPGATCFGNLTPCAISKDGKDTLTIGNYSK